MNVDKYENKLFVQLASCFDESRVLSFSRSELYAEQTKPFGNCFYEVLDLQAAKELCMGFINYFNLGASNWDGGLVTDNNNNFIAQISYNGRIWDHPNWKLAKEIAI